MDEDINKYCGEGVSKGAELEFRNELPTSSNGEDWEPKAKIGVGVGLGEVKSALHGAKVVLAASWCLILEGVALALACLSVGPFAARPLFSDGRSILRLLARFARLDSRSPVNTLAVLFLIPVALEGCMISSKAGASVTKGFEVKNWSESKQFANCEELEEGADATAKTFKHLV